MADIVIPHTFSPNTLIESSKVNANFTQLSTNSFNKVGGDTCEGNAVFEGNVEVQGTLTATGGITGLSIDAGDLVGTALAPAVVYSSLETVGTIREGTWNATLGAVSGANLTNLNADNLADGTVPTDRLSGLTPTNFNNQGVSQWVNDANYITTSDIGGIPSGVIAMYGGSTPPAGWLICQGSGYSTGAYPALFAVIGYTYGGSAGTFNIPNLQQRFPLGYTTGGGAGSTLGATGGVIEHQHTGPNHGHYLYEATLTSGSGGDHGHSLTGSSASGGTHSHTVSLDTSYVEVNHTHTFSTTVDGDHSHTLSGIGITSGSDDTAGVTSTSTDGDHSHSGLTTTPLASTSHRHAISGQSTASDGGHTHSAGTLAVASAAAHTHSVYVPAGLTAAGGTEVTSVNDPPYLTVNFIIKT